MNSINIVALGKKRIACPACRGYSLESQWCGHCGQKGYVLVDRHPVTKPKFGLAKNELR